MRCLHHPCGLETAPWGPWPPCSVQRTLMSTRQQPTTSLLEHHAATSGPEWVRVCVCVYNILNSPDRCSKSCVNVSVCLQAVECYTQALSEAGGQNQRTACSALSCLQVSGLSVYHNMPYVCKKSGLPPSSFLLYLLAVWSDLFLAWLQCKRWRTKRSVRVLCIKA